MSTTDSALDWLLSLSATLTSSPVPNSDSPDFTDWLRVSPTTSSPATSEPPSSSQLSQPLQDVTSSARVNQAQTKELGLSYLYDLSDYFADVSANSGSQNGRVLQESRIDMLTRESNAPAAFNEHNRMISLDSVTATLINTPSPRSIILLGGPTGGMRNDTGTASPFSSLFYSPATKYMQDLQGATFGSYLSDLPVPGLLPSGTPADVSPVVRASKMQLQSLSADKENRLKSKTKTKPKKGRRSRHVNPDISFVEKLRATEAPANVQSSSAIASGTGVHTAAVSGISEEAPLVFPLSENVLLSPCKLDATRAINTRRQNDLLLPIIPMLPLEPTAAQDFMANAPSTPAHRYPLEALSPLTPLSSVSDSSPQPLPRLKIKLNLKRARDETLDNSSVIRRSKRPRRTFIANSSPTPPSPTTPPLSQPTQAPEDMQPVYTRRTLPNDIEVSENFPLFYRRFPASSYYMHRSTDSPCTLFGVAHPGGIYNHPRSVLDLYTPRFVKGKGTEKVGLCPICMESPERGGEKKKLWLAMKFSAFKCYHMQYAHGISASTGRPFSPPTAFRVVARPNPGKKEKHRIQQGKCHKCSKWVAVEGIKDMESKVKELHWWKHAAACHQECSLVGEGDYFESDHVLAVLVSLKPTQEA